MRRWQLLSYSRNSLPLTEPRGSLPCYNPTSEHVSQCTMENRPKGFQIPTTMFLNHFIFRRETMHCSRQAPMFHRSLLPSSSVSSILVPVQHQWCHIPEDNRKTNPDGWNKADNANNPEVPNNPPLNFHTLKNIQSASRPVCDSNSQQMVLHCNDGLHSGAVATMEKTEVLLGGAWLTFYFHVTVLSVKLCLHVSGRPVLWELQHSVSLWSCRL